MLCNVGRQYLCSSSGLCQTLRTMQVFELSAAQRKSMRVTSNVFLFTHSVITVVSPSL